MEKPIANQSSVFRLVNGDPISLTNSKILIVGVGGIGCEILKVLCKMPIGAVHIIDMDTIQLSNLNRQFLFKKEHKGMSKALVAKETILNINPDFDVVAHHKNIKELPINFFKQFSFLIMALDNIEARNYVNKIGVRLNIPIIDAGTLGYKGNVTTIIPNQTKCYSCEPKSTQQKQFPVCTIRMRPEKPIHCIVWAKLLFQVFFGPQNQDNDLKDLAELAKKNDILEVMTKLFQNDILEIKNAKEDSENKLSEIFAKSIKVIPKEQLSQNIGLNSLESFQKHEQKLSVNQNIAIFSEALENLSKQKLKQSVIPFEKDDDNIIHFISSAANLRMHCFNIEKQSFNEVKNMAGNIVPAIASTNSIVSGIEVVQMMKLMKREKQKMRSYFVQNLNTKVIGLKLEKSFPTCQVCHMKSIPVIISANFSKYKLSDLVKTIKQRASQLEEFSINYGSKQFYNSDDPKQILLQKSILELCAAYEVDLIVTNEDTMKKVCIIWMIHDESAEQPIIEYGQQLSNNIQQEEPINQQQQPPQEDDDSDIVMFDDEASPEIEIIEVRKNNTQENGTLTQTNHKSDAQINGKNGMNGNTKKPETIDLDQKEHEVRAQKRQAEVIELDGQSSDSLKKKVKPNQSGLLL